MTATTSLKLPEDLKKRAAALAKAADKTPHAFLVEAIRNQVAQSELRRDFEKSALKARRTAQTTGVVYRMEDVHAEVRSIAAGKKVPQAKPVAWRA